MLVKVTEMMMMMAFAGHVTVLLPKTFTCYFTKPLDSTMRCARLSSILDLYVFFICLQAFEIHPLLLPEALAPECCVLSLLHLCSPGPGPPGVKSNVSQKPGPCAPFGVALNFTRVGMLMVPRDSRAHCQHVDLECEKQGQRRGQ